ncbi:sensor histidine kinase [Croceimicrobium hydrocarbonivorans]|uniref:histidine kinase n=1 Tax=Croceimicrobium hydrocarbonivorans TaxID=2761580 RepID=A0A7H0VIL5_9FLAO|nr:HAMP domain-containing sensor histidine kinase [Croceimicrobium hydrocarbonivorans]QNR25563.1 HAMP domain-containing histidine kinase [Croceimicrobium hydrocarbonivorans]
MDFYGRKNLWKFLLFVFAILIGLVTLFYTESFLKELRNEEVKKVNQWASAMSSALRAEKNADMLLVSQIINSNTTIPVIITNGTDSIVHSANLNSPRANDPDYLKKRLEQMRENGLFIEDYYVPNKKIVVYYESSNLLTKLRYYPIALLGVISLFILVAYFAFSGARKAEQDQVWNGLAKETAHQIGTPLSSLMGWLELMKLQEVDPNMVKEMEKDVKRLETITNRFSKIGSQPALRKTDMLLSTRQAVEYLRTRSPKKIEVECHVPFEPIYSEVNLPLFEWVIENLIRNAIDAIEGEGRIDVYLSSTDTKVQIDVVDTGKGIPPQKVNSVFRPGYSTKKRGWGLGLSLARRIIEDYHKGKIFVAESVLEGGTTFRILLPKVPA